MRWSKFAGIGSFVFAAVFVTSSNAMAEVDASCFTASAANCQPMVDIPLGIADTYNDKYKAYALLAWQNFLALNLPHDGHDKGLGVHDDNYTPEWVTYISPDDLFPEDGSTPRQFNAPFKVPPACSQPSTTASPAVALPQLAKGVLDEYVQANRMGPVVDKNGNYLRYGIGFNEVMYKYIVDNELYNREGQERFDHDNSDRYPTRIRWPQGNLQRKEIGSIFVKSSWMILTNNEKKEDFITAEAYIYTPQSDTTEGEAHIPVAHCEKKTVGLVGLHIVQRTPSAPQWVWATFEHKRNAPWYDEFSATPQGPFNLFDPATCAAEHGAPSCSFNRVPDHPWDPRTTGTKTNVVRMSRPGVEAEELNKTMEQKLHALSGPWQQYFLVDVQFPTINAPRDRATGEAIENPAYPDGLPTPSFLANSTMETYIQGLAPRQHTTGGHSIPADDTMHTDEEALADFVDGLSGGGAQRVTSSCIGCHLDASMVTGTDSNFVFALGRAKRKSAP